VNQVRVELGSELNPGKSVTVQGLLDLDNILLKVVPGEEPPVVEVVEDAEH
jgi:hypothetical protein